MAGKATDQHHHYYHKCGYRLPHACQPSFSRVTDAPVNLSSSLLRGRCFYLSPVNDEALLEVSPPPTYPAHVSLTSH